MTDRRAALVQCGGLWHNTHIMSRWMRFAFAILIGAGLGLGYGWLINPVKYVDTAPDTLRVDYKTDYVLMAAEAYRGDGDLDLALRRLALLGNLPPVEMVNQAILFAEKAGYTEADLEQMRRLLDALKAALPVVTPVESQSP